MVSHIKSRNAHTFFSLFKSLAVNTEIYINECLQPRLLPFIHNHQSDLNFQFVHDLAGALSSKETIALMKENLPFGNNTTNHQNVPQDKLIENLTLVRPCMVNWPAQYHMDNLILK